MYPAKSLYVTALIAALVAIGPLSTDMYLPAFPRLMSAFSADFGQVQRTLSLFLLGFALAQLIYGPLSDRFGRKPVLMAGMLLFFVCSLAIVFAERIETLTLLRLLQAIGGSAGPVLGRAMVRDIHGPRDSARLLSYIGTAMALAPAAAPILGGYLLIWFGWESIFLFLATYAAAGILLLRWQIPETAPRQQVPFSPARLLGNYLILLRHPGWRRYTLICAFSFGGLFTFLSGASFVIITFLGHPEEDFGLYFAVVVAGFMGGTLYAGRRVGRLGIDRLIRSGALISVLSGCLMGGLALAGVHHVNAIVLPQMGFMAGVGMMVPQAIAGALAPFPNMAGTASALLGFLQMSFGGLMGLLVGLLHDGTPLAMTLTIAAMGLLAMAGSRTLK